MTAPLSPAALLAALCAAAAALIAYGIEPSPLLAGGVLLLAAAPYATARVAAGAGAVWLAFYVGLNIDYAVPVGLLLAPRLGLLVPQRDAVGDAAEGLDRRVE